ncbi:ABC transporter permease [Undibacterium sp. CCC2.1]|uniref:ABC transporter permease n=2 Tax=Pseudomonadota TaxID=1224 RepID=UPI002AC9C897|nr:MULTISPECIES: ABC transporter permease [unclassified Undibacterium]MEB0140172.1 ABC transporter permease [Undibacterium sp. CCC2.1]MEB0172454.1 ABC transporter permease [Undibacterium sp. CCC1.1]MEB0176972.1 ABC transporter permease [Undibacterium sp. CCC3.4]MEB0215576.1 ABC transporter permease [Undibacterium sp. 5I2]WPX43717.1 ABC transporter permease [Undibacterium sp. CCC3.4]
MNYLQILAEAFRSMNGNRLRSLLTMLGIVIGIISVVLLLAVGDSMKRFIAKELAQLGTNMLFISPGGDRAQLQRMQSGKTAALTRQDADALTQLPSLAGAAAVLQGSFHLTVGNETATQTVHGVSAEMFALRGWKIDKGSSFSPAEVRASARTVVIGHKIADQFFYKLDPLGKWIRIDNVAFQIVGVLAGEGKQVDGGDLSQYVIAPITAVAANLVRTPFPNNVHYIIAQGKSGSNLADGIDDISELLRDRHHIKFEQPDDFRIDNLASFAQTARKISAGIASLLALIGAISLLVGGIGIMNIMLVSVTERTREIGIRMAIGAKPRDILLQFLTEAVVICLVGGVLGILLAGAAALVITANSQFEIRISLQAVMVACSFASLVGIFFGFYPARRASRLLPVACLRYE